MSTETPFWHYGVGGFLYIEDRRSGTTVASDVDRAYVHRIVDLLNLDAKPRREPTVSELLRAYE